MAELPAGTVTFLFTDIAGSTRLLQQLGADRYGELLADQRAILRTAIEKHDGQEVDTQGDAFFVSFPRATEAAAAAVQIQHALTAHDWPEGVEVKVRMGLHTGEPWLIEEGYVGMDVHRAARIAHAGHGGQVLLSEVTAGLLKRNLSEGINLKDLGEYQLKDLRSNWTIHQLVIADLPSEFPELNAKLVRLPLDSTPRKPITLPAFLQEDAIQFNSEPPVFVARERELERLDKFLEQARSGQGQVAFIVGEAGHGKTSLVREFATHAQRAYPNLVIALGNCHAYSGVGEPYLPFREILEMLTGDVESKWLAGAITRNHAQRLWTLIPEAVTALVNQGPDLIDNFLASSMLLSRAALHAPEGSVWLDRLKDLVAQKTRASGRLTPEQNRIFDDYYGFLETLASNQPILLVLEDLHWADVSSISLLFHLGRQVPTSRILIIGTYRPEDVSFESGAEQHPLESIVNEFKRQFGDTRIDLGQNHRMDSRGFVDALLDSEPNQLGEHFRQELTQRTDGHALFTVELLRDMQERGGLQQDEEGRWVEVPDLNWNILPARIEGVIERRFKQLDGELLQALTIASVEGEEFTAEAIAHVRGIDERKLVHKLSVELGKQRRLVSVQEVRWVGHKRLSIYRFRHNLFQKFLYDNLDEAEQPYLHEDVGKALEELYVGQTSEIATKLARHFSIAGTLDKAIHYSRLSGERAIERSAVVEAINHLSHGIKLIGMLPTNRKLARQEVIYQSLVGSAYQARKGYAAEEAKQAFERALELCNEWRLNARKFPVLLGLYGVHSGRVEVHNAFEVAKQALDIAQRTGVSGFLTTGHMMVGLSLFYMGQLVSAQGHLEQAIEYHKPDQPFISAAFNPALGSYRWLALVIQLLGYPEKARKLANTTLTVFQKEDDIHSLTVAHYTISQLYSLQRKLKETRKWAESSIKLSTEYGYPYWLALARYIGGWAIAYLADPQEGIENIQRSMRDFQIAGGGINPYGLGYLADAYRLAGQVEYGLATIDKALVALDKTGERFFEAEIHRLKAELLLLYGADKSKIAQSYRRAIDISRQQGAKWWELRATTGLARLLISQGEIDEARDLLSAIFGWFTEGFDTPDLKDAKELLGELDKNS